MNMDQDIASIYRKIEKRVNSKEGQKELQNIAERTRKARLKREKACQVRIEDLYRPITITACRTCSAGRP